MAGRSKLVLSIFGGGALSLALAACGGDGATCAEGTEEQNGQCVAAAGGGSGGCPEGQHMEDGQCVVDSLDDVAPTTVASPPGGTFPFGLTVVLTADEPATVYYTTDGSDPTTDSVSADSPASVDISDDVELKFFSVDLAGNEEAAQTEVYDIDSDPPADVTDLTATGGPNGVQLSWTNPADDDLADILVIRSSEVPVVFTPEAGKIYDVDTRPVPEVSVAFVGNAQNFNDTGAHEGLNHYAVWARSDAGVYSANAAEAFAARPPFEQDATIIVSLSDSTATVTQQPIDYHLEVIAAEYDTDTDRVTIDLGARSLVGRPVFNLKARAENVIGGNAISDFMYDGDPAYYYGPEAILPGEQAVRTIELGGVTGTVNPVEIELALERHPMAFAPGDFSSCARMIDVGSGLWTNVDCKPVKFEDSPGQGRARIAQMVMSPDGSKVFVGHRSHPFVSVLDLATMTISATAPLGMGYGTVSGLALSPDEQFLYATVSMGGHMRAGGCPTFNCPPPGSRSVDLVKLSSDTLMEQGRVNLVMGSDVGIGRRLSVNEAGTRGALSVDHEGLFFVVELGPMSASGFATPATRPRLVQIAPDGMEIYIVHTGSPGQIYKFNQVGGQLGPPIGIPGAAGFVRPGASGFSPNGTMFLSMLNHGGGPAFMSYNPVGNQFTPIVPTNNEIGGFTSAGDNTRLVALDRGDSQLRVFDVMGGINELPPVPIDNSPFFQGHFLQLSR